MEQDKTRLPKWVPIDAVQLDPANVRLHPMRNLDAIKASLTRFGQQKPIVVDKDGIVRAGNGTLQAAKALGWAEIWAVITDLDGVDATAYALADNRTGELAEWDLPNLAQLMQSMKDEGVDLKALGWEDYETDPLLKGDWTPPGKDILPQGDAQEAKLTIEVTAAQKQIIDQAAAKARAAAEDAAMTEGRALELICADYLAGA